MPFLQQGNADTVTLTAGQSIAVGAPVNSSANVLIPVGLPGGPLSVVAATTQTFGPYWTGATITVAASRGQVEYQVGSFPVVGGGGSLSPIASAAAQAGLTTGSLQGSRTSAVSGVLSLFGHQINTAGAAASFVLQSPALGAFYGSRTIHANYGTAAQTITIAKSAVTPTAGNVGTSLTWTTRTWGGATTVVQPAGSGTGADVIPSITVSDWLWVPSIARTDFPTRNFLILERAYYAATGSVQRSCFSNAMGDLFTATGLEFATNVAAGADAVTTITSFAPASTNTWMCPVGVEFAYGTPTVVVADVGDSLMRGQESSTTSNGWYSVSQRACVAKSGSVIWQASTFAITGQTHTASYQTGLEVVSKIAPTFLCFRAWSPNDGAPTQALIDAAWGRTLSLIEHCRRNRVAPVLCTTTPRNTLSAGEDAFLKIQNSRVRSLAGYVLVSDEAAVVEDPSDRSKLLPAFNSGDGLHITSAGYAAMAAVRAAALTA